MWSPVICSSNYALIHIILQHLLICTGDHAGSPLRVYAKIYKKLIHLKTESDVPPTLVLFLTV